MRMISAGECLVDPVSLLRQSGQNRDFKLLRFNQLAELRMRLVTAEIAPSLCDDAVPTSSTSTIDPHEAESWLVPFDFHVVMKLSARSIQIGKVVFEVCQCQAITLCRS